MIKIILAATAASALLGGAALAQTYGGYAPGAYGGQGYNQAPVNPPYDQGQYNQYDNGQHPQTNDYDNAGAYQQYQNAQSAYDSARDTSAQAQGDYAARSADYEMQRRDYARRMRAYERERARYDAIYGDGAYEIRYAAPLPPPPPYY